MVNKNGVKTHVPGEIHEIREQNRPRSRDAMKSPILSRLGQRSFYKGLGTTIDLKKYLKSHPQQGYLALLDLLNVAAAATFKPMPRREFDWDIS